MYCHMTFKVVYVQEIIANSTIQPPKIIVCHYSIQGINLYYVLPVPNMQTQLKIYQSCQRHS